MTFLNISLLKQNNRSSAPNSMVGAFYFSVRKIRINAHFNKNPPILAMYRGIIISAGLVYADVIIRKSFFAVKLCETCQIIISVLSVLNSNIKESLCSFRVRASK